VERHNNFDALRLLAALSVIFSHAFLLAEGRQDHEPLMWLTGGQTILGVAGVFVFFTMSGYLVMQSWDATGSAPRFLAKRALRVYPGLAVCLLLCALALGPAVTVLPSAEYFAESGAYDFVVANLLMDANHNGLPGVRFTEWPTGGIVDGPLWSLPCEVMMYLMLAGLGALGRLNLGIIAGLFAAGMAWLWFDTTASDWLVGSALWLLPFFAAGMALYRLRRTRIFDGRVALAAALGLALSVPLHGFVLLFPVFGSYLVLWLALERRLPVIPAARWGDLSYGLYIYGWPVEQAVLWAKGGPMPWWALFLWALPISAALAFLSWHLVEKRALRLKPRRAVPAARLASA
jgi:peptidoglycan/LPS O-acetylase OafA/YrhL